MEYKKIDKGEIELWGMSNLRQDQTNLPMIIWVHVKEGVSHGPRVKVNRSHSHKITTTDTASVSISDNPEIKVGDLNPKDFELVKQFIIKNKKALLDYWNLRIFTDELFKRIKPI